MNKIRTLLKAPVLTQSGYGNHSRQIFNALNNNPLFDLYVEPVGWGNCPFLTENTEEKQKILKCVEKKAVYQNQGKEEYDLFVHVTIPNEWERKAKFNVGVTAGIETDRVSHVWVQKCNEMDLVIVPSEHSRKVFMDTTVDWLNRETGQKGSFKVEKPILVSHEGVDTNIFRKFTEEEFKKSNLSELDFEPEFNFLHVGQWGKGGYGEDRKNIALLVRYFIEEFKGRKDVGLVLKVNMGRNSVLDYDACLDRLTQIKANFKPEEIPPIYLLHGNFTNEEMAALYNHPKIGAFISLTHGEGFGLPLLEASACELPVVATNWSGHLDFLKRGKFSAIDYDMREIPDAAVWDGVLVKGSRWAEVKEEDVKRRMKKMSSSTSIPRGWAKELSQSIKEEFDLSVVEQQFVDCIKMLLGQQVAQLNPLEYLQSLVDTPNNYNVVYTMPMSTGDVFISTAVIDGLVKHLPQDAKIYFATDPKYFDVLKGNPHIYKTIPWNQNMINIEFLEEVFDLALTPNVATQYTFSNWVRRGQGRLLAEEFANHCQVELGDYHIQLEPILKDDIGDYITFHPGSGTGQWEARKYVDWKEVLINIKKLCPELKIIQVGSADEPKFDEVDIDLRGKTTVNQLASVIKHSMMHLSIDTFTMHLAAAFDRPLVALFGSSHAKSTGPWFKNKETSKQILLESETKLTCGGRACYKYQCKINKEMPCINEIDPYEVFQACYHLLKNYEQKI